LDSIQAILYNKFAAIDKGAVNVPGIYHILEDMESVCAEQYILPSILGESTEFCKFPLALAWAVADDFCTSKDFPWLLRASLIVRSFAAELCIQGRYRHNRHQRLVFHPSSIADPLTERFRQLPHCYGMVEPRKEICCQSELG
jgi:hypothetical protein